MFLFHGWADPATAACLATDHSSSPTAAPTGDARRARSGTGAQRLCSSLAFPGAPGSAAGAAHELPT